MDLEPHLTSCTKMNSKSDLNVTPETELFEGNVGRNLHDIGFSHDFMDMALKHRQLETRQLKSFYNRNNTE